MEETVTFNVGGKVFTTTHGVTVFFQAAQILARPIRPRIFANLCDETVGDCVINSKEGGKRRRSSLRVCHSTYIYILQ